MDALFDHWPVDINDILIESAAKPQQEKESNVRLPAESPTICADLDDLPEDFFADLDLDIVQKRPTESASALPATNTNTNIFEHNLDLESLFELDDEDVFFSSPGTMNKPYVRLKIVSVTELFYTKEGSKFKFPEKIVECLVMVNDCAAINEGPVRAIIRGDWLHCRLAENAIINVIGPVRNGEIVIDDEQNYLITEPDYLITTTALADSLACLRRSVLSYRTQPAVEDNKPSASLICGSIAHELVEDALYTGNFADSYAVTRNVDRLIAQNIEKIACCEQNEQQVREHVLDIMKHFPDWCKTFLRSEPVVTPHSSSQKRHVVTFSAREKQAEQPAVCIPKVLELEENIWSVMFGLKGKVDATVLVKFKPPQSQSAECTHMIAPFELKTGSTTTSVQHRAQTLLYTLLLHDRYRRPVDYGLLYYISTGDLIRIPNWRTDLRAIIISRNRLAEEVSLRDRLPPQVNNDHMCKRCFQIDSCVMHHRLAEGGSAETSVVPALFLAKTAHLSDSPRYADFFRKWLGLLTMEESETAMTQSEIWRLDVATRAKSGQCYHDLALASCTEIEGAQGMNKFACVFRSGHLDKNDIPLPNVHINEGDPVTVSVQDPVQYAVAIGFVIKITPTRLTIGSDRPIKVVPGPEVCIEGQSTAFEPGRLHTGAASSRQTRFRVDRDDPASTYGLLRANIYKLFAADSAKLLDLIVNLREPQFLSTAMTMNEDRMRACNLLDDYNRMDSFQKSAFSRATQALDYLLILGMPGTGKTTTLAFIIRYLVQMADKSVLISSHTHSSIDHIALKLQEANVPFVRIGNSDKVNRQIDDDYLLSNQKFSTVAQVEHYYSSAKIVICTSLGLRHPLFTRKRFDYCIVDEASQLTLPACVGPLRMAQTFILVGDHYQLPPLVRSKEALAGGLGQSLFKQLAETHPSAMALLQNQYRMNDDIMLLANHLTYQNLLRCGSETVRMQVLDCPRDAAALTCNCCGQDASCWLRHILNPSCKVVFVDTDACNANDSSHGRSFCNEGEAGLMVQAARQAGIQDEQIALISPYRLQLKHLAFPEFPGVEVSTIDKYQGRDRDWIIISLVRSNASANVGELLRDWQRLNVAFTRAKKKLVLLGSAKTVLQHDSFVKLSELLKTRDWLFHLPADATSHQFA